MTDYGQFYDKDGKLLDDDVTPKKERCSSKSTSLKTIIQYAKKLNSLRKAAAKDGVCLDELEEAAKELA